MIKIAGIPVRMGRTKVVSGISGVVLVETWRRDIGYDL